MEARVFGTTLMEMQYTRSLFLLFLLDFAFRQLSMVIFLSVSFAYVLLSIISFLSYIIFVSLC